jgi:hypothetical protein
MWVFSCVSLSHRLEFLLWQSICLQVALTTTMPSIPTTCNKPIGWHHTTETLHSPHSPLYKLYIRATDFLLDSWTLRMGPIVFPETSVRNYHYLLHNNPEECISQMESKGSNRKMAIEQFKTNHKTQKLMWTNPQIKNHKRSHELRLIRPQMQHKYPDHGYLKFWTLLTPTVEKTVYLLHGFKYIRKPRNINVLFNQCWSYQHSSTFHQKWSRSDYEDF